jgi:hypothetical protein
VKLTTHLHLVPKSRMRGAIPQLPQYAFMAWCLVKAQGQLYLYRCCYCCCYYYYYCCYYYSVREMTKYGLDGPGSVPSKGWNFSLSHYVQTGSEAPSLLPDGLLGLKLPKRERITRLHQVTEVENKRSFTTSSPHVLIAWCLSTRTYLVLLSLLLLSYQQLLGADPLLGS